MSNIEKIYTDLLNNYPNLDYEINKKATDINEIKSILYQIDNDILINIMANSILEINKEKEKEEKKYSKLKEYEFDKYISLENMAKLLKYMYYEYDISTIDFMNICTKALKVEVNRDFAKYLLDNDIVKLYGDNKVSLSSKGIELSVSLGFTLEDSDKEEYVYKIKKKINS